MLFERVKELCKKRGISISELENRIGFGKNSIYKWKTQSPKIETLQKVADYFHV
ncbi:transcriptional regulator, partial [Enterococcus faecium]